jgi:hypothetical protein
VNVPLFKHKKGDPMGRFLFGIFFLTSVIALADQPATVDLNPGQSITLSPGTTTTVTCDANVEPRCYCQINTCSNNTTCYNLTLYGVGTLDTFTDHEDCEEAINSYLECEKQTKK